MKARSLPAATLACAVAVGGRYACEHLWGAGDAWQRGVEVAAALLAAAVVFQFRRGDPPRRPWMALFVAMLIIPLMRLATWLGLTIGGVSLKNLLLIAGNVVLAATIITFARVLGASELLSDRTAADRTRAVVFVGALATCALAFLAHNVVGVVMRGPPTTPEAWAGAVANLVSTLSDALVFAGGLYLVWLLRPLVGGSLARPYLLMAVGGAAFLVVDVWLVATGGSAQTDLTASVPKLVGTLAFSCFAAAALIQAALLRAGRGVA